MSGFFLDHTEALQTLRRLAADGEEQHARHTATSPSFPAAAAGRDFAERGAAIAAMLQRLHDQGTERIEAVQHTAGAAGRQVRVLVGVDKQLDADLGGGR